MKRSIKIFLLTLVVLMQGSIGFQGVVYSETNQCTVLPGHFSAAGVDYSASKLLHPLIYHWASPVPERLADLLLAEETEDSNLSWIQLKKSKIHPICISSIFGAPDADIHLFRNEELPSTSFIASPSEPIRVRFQVFRI